MGVQKHTWPWNKVFNLSDRTSKTKTASFTAPMEGHEESKQNMPEKWSMGVLNDKETDEVPGSVLLMSNTNRNEPLGLRNAPARTSVSSLPSPFPPSSKQDSCEEKKKTANGQIILEPQPDDSKNDPLNWPSWRRDIALLSLGFYCMIGGGMTPVLAAGFNNVASTYHVTIPQVALTTGLYMMGLGLGSVVASPTAILYGKRPVYLVGILLFIVSAIWCAASPNYTSLVVARIFMGLAVSPVECLPSATIAEIFFLHERAYRLGIYTLLLLSGKNLIPLVSAVIVQSLSWEWVFWIVAMVVGFCFVLVFFFVPETFWDRTPRPKNLSKGLKQTFASLSAMFTPIGHNKIDSEALGHDGEQDMSKIAMNKSAATVRSGSVKGTIAQRRRQKHVGFANVSNIIGVSHPSALASPEYHDASSRQHTPSVIPKDTTPSQPSRHPDPPTIEVSRVGAQSSTVAPIESIESWKVNPNGEAAKTPDLHSFNSPYYFTKERPGTDYLNNQHDEDVPSSAVVEPGSALTMPTTATFSENSTAPSPRQYTTHLRTQPPKTFLQNLRPWNGQLVHENWLKVAIRPFILFAYPSILWSTLVYSLSIGWLIVLSESVSSIYRSPGDYTFSALGTGLVYISPFIGGVLGTAVAGKVSDIIVRFMSRRNGGVYEPEFRLVMAIPVAVATCVGLMGFGWSAQEKDKWIVPTVFFGIISFGCALGSTTAITFAVDSYRQYAGEALVTLNFSKNIFHGLIFSLFFNRWLEADGSKKVFLAIGGIQLACLMTTIPMYIYGKRARMWTVRKNLMEKF